MGAISRDDAQSGSLSPGSGEEGTKEGATIVDDQKLLRKIDLRVMPILFLIYIVAFLDRVNVSNALTLGLPADLGLTGQQPNIALTIFFVPYIIFEIPSNLLMKKLKPHLWLSGSILLFGIVMLGQGFVRTYGQLLATRFLLGLTEAGIFPGSFYLISFWYKREEAQKRFTVYWSSVILAGAFGGLLATAISKMNGISGLASWRWIFILEGLASIVVGIAAFFLVSDFPQDAQWINEAERESVLTKTLTQHADTAPVSIKEVVRFFKDIKNFLGAIMYFTIVTPIYAFAYFTPTIVKVLGYSSVQTQLHSVPPFAAAFGLCMVTAYISDRMQLRYPFIAFGYIILIAGLAILMTTHGSAHFAAEYAALCLVCMGSFSAGTSIVCWYLMNLHGHAERAIGSAWMIGFGNIGGILATFAFVKSDAPSYHAGYTLCLVVSVIGAASCMVYGSCVWKERRSAGGAASDSKPRPLLSL